MCYVAEAITESRSNQSKQQIIGWCLTLTLARKSLFESWYFLICFTLYLEWAVHRKEKIHMNIWPNSIRDWNPFPRTVERIRRRIRKKKYSNKYWPREIRYTDIQSIKLIGKWQRINKQRSGLFVCSPIICVTGCHWVTDDSLYAQNCKVNIYIYIHMFESQKPYKIWIKKKDCETLKWILCFQCSSTDIIWLLMTTKKIHTVHFSLSLCCRKIFVNTYILSKHKARHKHTHIHRHRMKLRYTIGRYWFSWIEIDTLEFRSKKQA